MEMVVTHNAHVSCCTLFSTTYATQIRGYSSSPTSSKLNNNNVTRRYTLHRFVLDEMNTAFGTKIGPPCDAYIVNRGHVRNL